ncbi:glucosyltransferase [Linderina macrospora]|uniref:Glucosyltransferase n=1 Tax=Linderina macrospora TaxID=4868 RepID=A0ACC1JCN8_9FUNG|nr:glucosyltransferase [Linderina macrospora]
MSRLPFAVAAFGVYAAASLALLRHINLAVPEPYMDEIFHIPQAQRYCAGLFREWDPKLTTPPGLYLVSLVPAWMLGVSPCSVEMLRTTNWVLGLALFWTMRFLVTRHSQPQATALNSALLTLVLALFPVTFFLNHLYYTDTGSLLFVLLAYALSLQERHALAGLAGFVSLWFRQTNVVWVAFVGFSAALTSIQRKHGIADSNRGLSLVQLLKWLLRFDGHVLSILLLLTPYLAVVGLFAVFLYANQGIVLGDKSHHAAGVHLPQMFYFCSYVVGISAPSIVLSASPLRFVRRLTSRPRRFILEIALCAIMMAIIRRFTIEHPFLLSDNRHYPFYIWKNIYRRHWAVRYAVTPLYTYAAWAMYQCIKLRQSTLWLLALTACTMAVLVPSPLLEFRYFTAPYFFFRLNCSQPSTRSTVLELAWFVVVNALTVWIFLNKPFTWDSEPGRLQRFMW